jgi:dTDP-L-rhamnose 4-epimerase
VIAKVQGANIEPKIENSYRKGDVRHCYSDTKKIESKLDFKPNVSFEEGIREIIDWAKEVKAEDNLDKAINELKEKGLV